MGLAFSKQVYILQVMCIQDIICKILFPSDMYTGFQKYSLQVVWIGCFRDLGQCRAWFADGMDTTFFKVTLVQNLVLL